MAYRILIPEDISEKGKQYLLDRGYLIKIGRGNEEDIICEDVTDCDALLVRNTRYTRRIMEAGKALKVIARHGTGVDNIDLEAAAELGIQVVNGPAANINAVAEFTVALMTALSCDLFGIDRETRNLNWEFRTHYKRGEISEKTIGIIGFGNIGQAVARMLKAAFKPAVIVYDKYVDEEKIPQGVRHAEHLEELLKESDIITLHVPSVKETKGMMGRRQFQMMKRGAFLINCSRGDICVEEELCDALERGDLGGAALDVFKREPLPPESRLLKMRNVILSQHCAGLSEAAADRMAVFAAQGIDEVLSGKQLSWPVNNMIKGEQDVRQRRL